MPVKGMVMTEMQKLKTKKTRGTASQGDLERLKVLQDGEPLSAADLENAKKREEERASADKTVFASKHEEPKTITVAAQAESMKAMAMSGVETSLDVPAGAPACFGKFFSIGALDCTTECKFTEDCKRRSKNPNPGFLASLDAPAEHPRIAKIKEALLPFTQIEAHATRPDEFVLFTRGISITAGDVRKARQAMKT